MENRTASSDKANSIFSLTLDEFQTKSGKSFGSMNIDEILNFLNEGNSDCVNLTRKYQNEPIQPAKLAPRESFSIPTTLSGKTVEEILFDIDKDQAENPSLNLNIGTHDPTFYQESLENMTLEDFLVKIGIFKKSPMFFYQKSVHEIFQNPCVDMGYHGQLFSNDPSSYGANNLLGESSSMYKMFSQGGGINILSQPCNDDNNNNGNENGSDQNGNGNSIATDHVSDPRNKRRATNDQSEEILDMKQRRMIKNRESAARSRARKQVHISTLSISLLYFVSC